MDAQLTTRVALPWSYGLAWVKKALTITSTPTMGKSAILQMYEIIDDTIYMPKAWALQNQVKLGIQSFADHQIVAEKIQIEDTELSLPLGLRPHQISAVDAIVKAFHDEPLGGGALLCLPCGFGKSVAALEVIHRMGLKTLIIVNTAILATQWKNVIAQYVPGARVGMIQQSKFEVENRTHVVAVAHTVAGGRYDFNDAGFGMLFVDEIHRICCPTLSKCITNAGCRYRLGMTATLIRPDGFDAFLKCAIGKIAFQTQRDKLEDLKVYAVYLDAGPSVMHTIMVKGKSTPCIAKMLNDMVAANGDRAVQRQQVACKWVQLCVARKRQVLVVADRISMLEDLAERVAADGTGIITAFLIGKTKAKDRDAAKDANVILASYACASEGLDVNTLDSILFLTPRSGSNCIVQCVGRLLRLGGRWPLIIDLVDELRPFQNMHRKRCTEYRRMGAIITRWNEQFLKI